MGRIGILEEHAVAVAREILALRGLTVTGLASHLPVADEDDASKLRAVVIVTKDTVKVVQEYIYFQLVTCGQANCALQQSGASRSRWRGHGFEGKTPAVGARC